MGSNLMYSLQDVAGRGKGLVAVEKIPKGTRILSEEPVVTEPDSYEGSLEAKLLRQVESLSKEQRESVLSMHNLYPYQNVGEQVMGIFKTNGLPIEDKGIRGGIFLKACRINHSCDNNAQKSWNSLIGRHTVHALRDIAKGEEITITYLGIDSIRAVRQKKLQDKFGFWCSCRLCSLPQEQSQECDRRLERIAQLDNLVGQDGMRMNFTLKTLRYVDEQIRLYNEQGEGDSGLGRAYVDAAQIATANGDLARAGIFMKRAMEGFRTTGGGDCRIVIQYEPMLRDPRRFGLYGVTSMRWGTSLNELPQGLDSEAFEDWLWRRGNTMAAKQVKPLVDLRDREIYPGFDAVPNEGSVDMNDHEHDGGSQQSRYWCFLGEIVDSTTLHHLELELKDVDNKTVPLHFYTDGLGREMSASQVRAGYTVAVPYAQRRRFQYSSPGIRHNDPMMLKIFPLSLKELFDLNDQVQEYSKKIEESRTCHGCGKKATNLNRCGKCCLFWYCDSHCQAIGWKEKGHKENCKLLRNADLQHLITCKWVAGGASST